MSDIDKRAQRHADTARELYELAIAKAREWSPIASDIVIRDTAFSLLRSALEMGRAHCNYQTRDK